MVNDSVAGNYFDNAIHDDPLTVKSLVSRVCALANDVNANAKPVLNR